MWTRSIPFFKGLRKHKVDNVSVCISECFDYEESLVNIHVLLSSHACAYQFNLKTEMDGEQAVVIV